MTKMMRRRYFCVPVGSRPRRARRRCTCRAVGRGLRAFLRRWSPCARSRCRCESNPPSPELLGPAGPYSACDRCVRRCARQPPADPPALGVHRNNSHVDHHALLHAVTRSIPGLIGGSGLSELVEAKLISLQSVPFPHGRRNIYWFEPLSVRYGATVERATESTDDRGRAPVVPPPEQSKEDRTPMTGPGGDRSPITGGDRTPVSGDKDSIDKGSVRTTYLPPSEVGAAPVPQPQETQRRTRALSKQSRSPSI
jgi:hypothetical protein